MFAAWSALVHRLRWTIVVTACAVVLPAAVWGSGVADHLSDDGLTPPGTESERADSLLAGRHGAAPDALLLYQGDRAGFGDPAFDAAVRSSVAALPRADAPDVTGPWNAPDRATAAALVSDDRRSVAVRVRLAGDGDTAKADALERVRQRADVPALREAGVDLRVGGETAFRAEMKEQAWADLTRAELLAFPLLLVLLLWVFGSAVSAALPLAIGGVAVVGSTVVLRALSAFTEISTLALNVVTMLGLGLAVDYALFLVSRFREELHAGRDVPGALATTLRTSGRTVLVSGLIVGISLSGLLMFDLGSLRSVGLGGLAVTLLSMAAALTLLPALLAVLGRRIDRLPVGRRARPTATTADGRWARVARAIMRRPVRSLLLTTAVLVLLGLPFLRVEYVPSGIHSAPADAEPREVAETVTADFSAARPPTATVVLPGLEDDRSGRAALAGYLDRVRDLPGVRDARPIGGDGPAAVAVTTGTGEHAPEADRLVSRLRELPPPPGAEEALVGGAEAELDDTLASLRADLPAMLALVAGVTFGLLLAAFGSLLLPLKALVVGALSLTASFGVVVWAFQEGHLAGPLGFEPPPGTDPAVIILVFAIAFGLSMDYEVFLLGRVREEWLRGGDNTSAVAVGLQRTAGLITGAALLFAVVLAALSTADVVLVMTVGVGLFAAIVIDATLVRAVLVPAAMRLMGAANWWLPRPLAAVHGRGERALGADRPDAPAVGAAHTAREGHDVSPAGSAPRR